MKLQKQVFVLMTVKAALLEMNKGVLDNSI